MDHYEFLGIGRATLPSLVRGAINRKQRQFDARGASPEQQQQLDNARRVLLSETLRLEYDATLTDLPGTHAPRAPTTGVSPSRTFPWQASAPATPSAPHQPTRSLAILRVLVPLLLSILVLLHVAVIAAVAQALDILARIESGTPVSFAEAQDSDRLVEIRPV